MGRENLKSEHYRLLIEKIVERRLALSAKISEVLSAKDSTFLTLEIGCGHGHFLTEYAQSFSDELCFGIDIMAQRLGRCERKKQQKNLGNIHFFKAEATEFLTAFPKKHFFNRVFILFPDPWPKRRHAKNRLLSSSFLENLSEVCDEKAVIYLRTDDFNYFNWAKNEVQANGLWFYDEQFDWPFEAVSFFQSIHPEFFSLKIFRSRRVLAKKLTM